MDFRCDIGVRLPDSASGGMEFVPETLRAMDAGVSTTPVGGDGVESELFCA